MLLLPVVVVVVAAAAVVVGVAAGAGEGGKVALAIEAVLPEGDAVVDDEVVVGIGVLC